MSNTKKQDAKRQSLQLRTTYDPPSTHSYTPTNKRDPRIKSFYVPTHEITAKKRMSVSKEDKRKSHIKLLQLLSNQQHYEASIQQCVALKNEIALLTEKLVSTEEKVSKWKKDFKDLQGKFSHAIKDHQTVREELEDTRRMLAESEHIRSRWFLKTPPHQEEYTAPKRLPQTHHHRYE